MTMRQRRQSLNRTLAKRSYKIYLSKSFGLRHAPTGGGVYIDIVNELQKITPYKSMKLSFRRGRSSSYGKIYRAACQFVRRYGRQNNPAVPATNWRAIW